MSVSLAESVSCQIGTKLPAGTQFKGKRDSRHRSSLLFRIVFLCFCKTAANEIWRYEQFYCFIMNKS